MTQKDYVPIAAAIKDCVDFYDEGVATEAIAKVASEVANVMARDNGRFDRKLFMSACGFEVR